MQTIAKYLLVVDILNFYCATLCYRAVYAVVVCPSLRPSVLPSHADIVSKRLDESSWFSAPEVSFHLSHTVL